LQEFVSKEEQESNTQVLKDIINEIKVKYHDEINANKKDSNADKASKKDQQDSKGTEGFLSHYILKDLGVSHFATSNESRDVGGAQNLPAKLRVLLNKDFNMKPHKHSVVLKSRTHGHCCDLCRKGAGSMAYLYRCYTCD